MVGEWVVCSHGPAIRSNIVNLDVKIAADSGAGDAIDFAVQIGGAVEVGRDGIRGEVSVIRIAGRVVAPERSRRVEVLVHTAKQVDIGAVGCAAEPAPRGRKRGSGRPGIGPRGLFISVCDSAVVDDAAETINVATLCNHGMSGDGDGIRSLLGPRADRSARRGGGSWRSYRR